MLGIGFRTLLYKEVLRFWKGQASSEAEAPLAGMRAGRAQPTFQLAETQA